MRAAPAPAAAAEHRSTPARSRCAPPCPAGRRYDFAEWLSSRLNMQLSNEAGQSQLMGDLDVKGRDWNAQLKLGNPQFLGERRGEWAWARVALLGGWAACCVCVP